MTFAESPSAERTFADRTLQAYGTYAGLAIENWEKNAKPSAFLRRFVRALPPRAHVLDYGCGIGTELAWMKGCGLAVEGIDGTAVFIKEARRRLKGVPLRCVKFEDAALSQQAYDGVWCNASLIHVPPREFADQLPKLQAALKPSGLLGMTLAWGNKKGFAENDWIPGRYIAGYTRTEAAHFFRQWAVRDLRVTTHDGRSGRWIQILAERSSGHAQAAHSHRGR